MLNEKQFLALLRGLNSSDADGRHASIEAAQRLKLRTIDMALRSNDNVIVRMLKALPSAALARVVSNRRLDPTQRITAWTLNCKPSGR